MLAALTLALQKFNIQTRRGTPGFREQRPRPRKKPQSGRKLPKRLRHGNESDRSRPTSPESGSFYTPASTPTFSPFTTPPESPRFSRKVLNQDVYMYDNQCNGIDEQIEPVACHPVQSSAYINLNQPHHINGYAEQLSQLHDNLAHSNSQDQSNILQSQNLQQQVIEEDAIVAETLVDVQQAPPVNQIINQFNATSQPLPILKKTQSVDSKANASTSSLPQLVPVEEDIVDVVQATSAQFAPPPQTAQGQQYFENVPFKLRLNTTRISTSTQTVPESPLFQPDLQPTFKQPHIDANILSAFNRVQDYFDRHPEHKNLTHEQLVQSWDEKPEAKEDRSVLDQLGKDHQYLLRRFIEQQDSSDDESGAEERFNSVKKNKTKPIKRQRPADRKPHLGGDWLHSTTQTDEDQEATQRQEKRPLRLPNVEDLFASQSKKKLGSKQPTPSGPQKPSGPAATINSIGASKQQGSSKAIGKKTKAAKSYEQLVLELEPLVTPVAPPSAAAAAHPPSAGPVAGSVAAWVSSAAAATASPATSTAAASAATSAAASGRVTAAGSSAGGTGSSSLWRDVWGSWGVWLIARFSATGQGGDVKEASSEFDKDKYIQQRPKDRPTDRPTSKEAYNIAAMPGPTRDISVRLVRDSLNTPWGFRLQGGQDFKQPLTVQRVFVGSPADTNLQRGDVILRINNIDVLQLSHKQAQDIVKQAGGDVSLSVRRSAQDGSGVGPGSPQLVIVPSVPDPAVGQFRPMEGPSGALGFVPALPRNLYRAPAPPQPTVPSFGQDYRRGGFRVDPKPRAPEPRTMLTKLNQSLNQSLWTPGQPDTEDYQFTPVSQLKQNYNAVNNAADMRRQQAGPMSTGKIWSKPPPEVGTLPSGLGEPGWSAGAGGQGQQGGAWSSVRAPGSAGSFVPTPVNRPPPVNRPQPVNRAPPTYKVPQIQDDGPPAWYGSLRSGGGVRNWEAKAAADIIDEGAAMGGTPMAPAGQQAPVQAQTLSPRQVSGQASPRSPGGSVGSGPVNDVQVHNPRVQQMSYGPTGQEYRQLDPSEQAENATVQHLQYNTPIGLYSKANVQATLKNQTAGKPGEGTMQVQGTGGPGAKKEFDPSRSSVLALLQAEESGRHPGPPPQQQAQQVQQQQQYQQPQQSARYVEERPQYQGYVDHSKQSPSMHALEAHVEADGPGGSTDF